jgi:hypothetical protein
MLPLLPLAAQAQAPANDNPSGAVALPLGTTCTPLSTTNTGATTTTVTGLGYTNPGCGIAASPKDVWYTFTTAASGQQGSTAVTITVSGTPAGQVRVFSSAGGAAGPFVTVGCSAGTTNNTQAPALSLRGLTPATTYYVDVSGYGSADTQGAFTICATSITLPANDVAVTGIYSLGQVAQNYNSPQVARAVVTNLSLGTLTNIPVTLTVSGASTFTATQTVATLAPNATATVTFPSYPLAALGTNTLTVTVPADDLASNNSQVFTQNVTASRLAFIDGTQPLNATGVGIGAAGGILAAKYTLSQAGTIASVTPSFVGAGAGATTYQVQLYDATGTGGTPGNLLYTSPTQTRPTATGSPVISVPNVPIAAGDFFVAIKELDLNVGLGYQVEDPLRPTTFYYQVPSSPWAAVNTTTLRTRLALEVSVTPAPACAAVQGLTTTGVTTTAASVTFTPITGATYTVTYQAANGAVQTVSPNPSASPVALSGLTPSTTYTVTVVTNCSGGTTSAPITTTFTTGATAPANDNCATATALTVGTTCTNTVGTTVGATASPAGVPAPSCGTSTSGTLTDVWYTVTVPTNGNLTVTTSEVVGSAFDDTVVEIYSGTCGALTSVGCNDDVPNPVDGFSSLTLTGQTPGATLYVRVRGYGSTPAGQFNICATTPAPLPANDAAVTVIYSLGKVSSTFGSPVTAQAVITNAGSTALTSLPVTLTVSGATTYTNTQTVPSLAVGASTTVTFTYPVTVSSGTNTLTVTVPTDALASNNSQVFTQTISNNSLSYVSGTTFDGGAGLAAAGSVIAIGYRTTGAAAINTVTPSFAGTASSATATYQVLIYSASNGQPGTVLYTSPARPRPVGATGTIVTDAVSIPNIAVNGAFFVGIKSIAADNLSIAYQVEAPLRPGVFLFTTNGTTWTDINTSTLNSRLAVDVTLGTVTSARNEALAATVSLYPNPAHQAFQLSIPAGSLTKAAATLTNTLGQVVLKRQLNLPVAGGAADFNVSSLAPGVYSLTLKSGDDLVVKRVVVE